MTAIKTLYKKNEDIIINAKIPTLALDQKNDEEANFFQESPDIKNTELFDSIKEIFTSDRDTKKDIIYFTLAKGLTDYSINNSVFMPSSLTLLQPKKFEELYLNQLESYIYNAKEDIDADKLFPIIYVFSLLKNKKYPVKINSTNYNKLLVKICKVLNIFFSKNYSVIHSMHNLLVPLCEQDNQIDVKEKANG